MCGEAYRKNSVDVFQNILSLGNCMNIFVYVPIVILLIADVFQGGRGGVNLTSGDFRTPSENVVMACEAVMQVPSWLCIVMLSEVVVMLRTMVER